MRACGRRCPQAPAAPMEMHGPPHCTLRRPPQACRSSLGVLGACSRERSLAQLAAARLSALDIAGLAHQPACASKAAGSARQLYGATWRAALLARPAARPGAMGNLQSAHGEGLSKAELERMERRWAAAAVAAAPPPALWVFGGSHTTPSICIHTPYLLPFARPLDPALLASPPRAGSSGWGAARRSWPARSSR